MALTLQAQGYLDFALGALPRWMNPTDEFLNGSAAMFGGVQTTIDYWFGQTLIGNATGPAAGTPDWLRQHARDRGTDRQFGESDPALRQRIRNVPDALTVSALKNAANAILVADGISTPVGLLELPRDGAFARSLGTDTAATGGVFATYNGNMLFTPTQRFACAPFRDPSVQRLIAGYSLTIAGAANAGNDGTFPTLGMLGDGVIFANASGVVGSDGGATWTVNKLDRRGNNRNGFAISYAGRGYRASASRTLIVMILPYGSTAGTEASIREMLRQKKAAGFAVLVERRLDP